MTCPLAHPSLLIREMLDGRADILSNPCFKLAAFAHSYKHELEKMLRGR